MKLLIRMRKKRTMRRMEKMIKVLQPLLSRKSLKLCKGRSNSQAIVGWWWWVEHGYLTEQPRRMDVELGIAYFVPLPSLLSPSPRLTSCHACPPLPTSSSAYSGRGEGMRRRGAISQEQGAGAGALAAAPRRRRERRLRKRRRTRTGPSTHNAG